MRKALIAGLLLASTAAFGGPPATGDEVQKGSPLPPRTIRLLSPRPGTRLTPGKAVRIQWESSYPSVVYKQSGPVFAEQEIYLSLDGGLTFPVRVSPQLARGATSYTWIVPNVAVENAVFDIRIGFQSDEAEEGGTPKLDPEGLLAETSNIQRSSPFAIDGSPSLPSIELSTPATAQPGSAVRVSWASTLPGEARYELLVSCDRGAHYTSAGTTSGTSLDWAVPSGYAGSALFRVVARDAEGSVVESLVRPAGAVRIE